MNDQDILTLGQGLDRLGKRNVYWIGVNLKPPRTERTQGNGFVLGGVCQTIEELEDRAEEIRASLDRVLEEVRSRIRRS
jgi:hypothetical protein